MTPADPTPELLWRDIDVDGALAETEASMTRWTRAGVLRAGAGVLTGALAGPAAAAWGAGKDRPDRGDRAILNYALTLEELQAAFYTETERAGSLRGATARQARVVGAHERAHVKAFRETLGRYAIRKPAFDFRGVTEDPDAFLRTAVAFEDLAVAAYKGQAPSIRSKEYLAAAISIHSVEARHAGRIRRLAGRLPVSGAFDEPLPAKEVRRVVASTRFVTSRPKTTSKKGKPRFTG